MLAQKDGAGVAHAFQAALGHGEHANFVHRTEAVLDGADEAEVAVRVALEVQHRVHHVLQHARAGQRTFFGHVAHQHHRHARGFGRARELGRALAHLRHRAGGGRELLAVHGLNGVDHAHRGPLGVDGGQNLFHRNFGQHPHLAAIQPQAARAQGHLCARFFARHIQRGHRQAQLVQRLQQQRAFANAGVAADQHHAAFHHATAQHAVQLVQAGGQALEVGRVNVGQRGHGCAAASEAKRFLAAGAAVSATASISVFHAPQLGHLPSHLGLVPPHSVQL
jgi:hypothetical protein